MEWLFNLINDLIAEAITKAIEFAYTAILEGMNWFIGSMSQMGTELFNYPSIQMLTRLAQLLGWMLFVVGAVVAVSEFGIEQGSGRTSVKGVALNILKGALAASLFATVPPALYKACATLQVTFLGEVAQGVTIQSAAGDVLGAVDALVENLLISLLLLIACGYCLVKVFFANIKRSGILLCQIAVGSLYMASVPRGYTDGFTQWCKEIIALCLTAFLQTALLYLGLIIFIDDQFLGLGIMLTANEVPRIAGRFGLDSSIKVHMASAVYTTSAAVNLVRTIRR